MSCIELSHAFVAHVCVAAAGEYRNGSVFAAYDARHAREHLSIIDEACSSTSRTLNVHVALVSVSKTLSATVGLACVILSVRTIGKVALLEQRHFVIVPTQAVV